MFKTKHLKIKAANRSPLTITNVGCQNTKTKKKVKKNLK